MRVYLAGPMRGQVKFNYPAFQRVATTMRGCGHVVFSPSESFGGDTYHVQELYARFDIHALLQVEGVVLLPGWEQSDGAKREVVIAEWLGLHFFSWEESSPGTWPDYRLVPQVPKVRIHSEKTA